jgi:ParB family chromosome partitioning protein
MANANRGLGKGLGALLGDVALRTDTSDSLYLPISQIEPYANQPRHHFDEDALQDLADSIREHGIIQPLTVRRLSSGYYQIIAGERRWRAARIAGLSEVPAIVIEADDRKMTELSLIENLQREDLNPIEEAEGYKTLMDNYQLTQEEAAERVGKSRSAVANSLRLLGLCPEVREMLQNGVLSGGHARALPLKADLQLEAAKAVAAQGLSVRQTEALAKRLANPKEERILSNDERIAESYGRLAAQELSDKIGRTCRIVSGKKKGRVELDYYGIDDLNDLLEALAAIKRRKDGSEKE